MAGQQLLKLLRLQETYPDRKRLASIPVSRINGYPIEHAENSLAFHEHLKLASNIGAIIIRWRKHYEGIEIQAIDLKDVDKLAKFLGKVPLKERINKISESIDYMDCPDWLKAVFTKIFEQWQRGKSCYGLNLENSDTLPDIIKSIVAIESLPVNTSLDYRQFSIRYLGNTKRLKDISGALASLYREQLGMEGISERDVLLQLNLVPLEQPVLIRGPIKLSSGTQSISCDYIPYIGLSEQLLGDVHILRPPAYVLTIENLSSFLEYVNQIQDDGIVIYTAGYPVRALQRFYKKLAETTVTPLYHWGDTDPHGFLILKTLQNNVPNNIIHSHLMNPDKGEIYSAAQMSQLAKVLPINKEVDKVISCLMKQGEGCIEQESVRAVSPVCK